MTRKQDSAKGVNWKEVLAGEREDFLRPRVQEIVQQVLEAEMEEALSAGKGERTANRLGYRAGYYGRTLVTRVGKLDCVCRRTGRDGSGPRCSSGISEVRRRW